MLILPPTRVNEPSQAAVDESVADESVTDETVPVFEKKPAQTRWAGFAISKWELQRCGA